MRKPNKKATKKAAQPKKRKVKAPEYKHFKLSKKIKARSSPLPGAWALIRYSFSFIFAHKKLFFGFVVIQSILSLFFVAGLGASWDFVDTKKEVETFLGGQAGIGTSTITLFSYLVSTATNGASELSGAYQLFLTLITSLAVIWAVRQNMAGEKVSFKEAYYSGLYPMVPFLLVLFVIGLQLLPALVGSTVYSIVIGNGLAVTALESFLWLLLFILLCLLSLYMIFSSIFALYIVTLPGMTPLKALRSARALVLHRRLGVGLRVLAMPVFLGVLSLLVLLPTILILPWLAVGSFIIFSSLSLCAYHVYMYKLYRELL